MRSRSKSLREVSAQFTERIVKVLAVVHAIGLCGLIGLAPLVSYGASEVPTSFTLDGRLFSDSAGTTPLVDSSVGLKLQVLNQDKTCILYEESQTISTVPTNGYFSVQVGSAIADTKRTPDDPGHTMSVVYQNEANITGVRVSDGTACTHTASSASRRHLRVVVTSSVIAGGARTLSPDLSIDAVPHALVAGRAETLGGVAKDQFLQVNTTGSNQLTQANLESVFATTGNVTALSSLIAGTNTNYVRSVANTGAAIPSYAGDPATPAVGSIWYDSAGQTIRLQTGTGAVSLATGSSAPELPAAAGSAVAPAYAFSGDTNTGLFSPAADSVALSTAGDERLRVGSNGRVGIGTATGHSRLSVWGDTLGSIFDVSNGGGVRVFEVGVDTGGANHGYLRVRKKTGDDVLAINGDPNNGPVAFVDAAEFSMVDGTNTLYGAGLVVRSAKAIGAENGVIFSNGSSFSIAPGAGITGYTTSTAFDSTQGLRFKTNDGTTFTTKMTITPSGNVGIGSGSPSSALDINGGLTFREMAAPALSSLDQGRIYFDSTANKFKVSENGGAYVDLIGGGSGLTGSGTAATLPIFTGASTLGNSSISETTTVNLDKGLMVRGSRSVVSDGGNTLTVAGSGGSGGKLLLGWDGSVISEMSSAKPFQVFSGGTATLQINSGEGAKWNFSSNYTVNNNLTISPVAGGGDLVISGASLGIGVVAPQTRLQVDGVISPAVNNTYSLGNATYRFTEVFATNGVINTSDAREKSEIRDLDLGLSFINQLRPVSYKWNTGVDEVVHYGVIAQETEQVLQARGRSPNSTSIVTYDPKADRYGVRYTELVAPLIQAVKELYQKVLDLEATASNQSELEARLKALEVENTALRARAQEQDHTLDTLKKRLDALENR